MVACLCLLQKNATTLLTLGFLTFKGVERRANGSLRLIMMEWLFLHIFPFPISTDGTPYKYFSFKSKNRKQKITCLLFGGETSSREIHFFLPRMACYLKFKDVFGSLSCILWWVFDLDACNEEAGIITELWQSVCALGPVLVVLNIANYIFCSTASLS